MLVFVLLRGVGYCKNSFSGVLFSCLCTSATLSVLCGDVCPFWTHGLLELVCLGFAVTVQVVHLTVLLSICHLHLATVTKEQCCSGCSCSVNSCFTKDSLSLMKSLVTQHMVCGEHQAL